MLSIIIRPPTQFQLHSVLTYNASISQYSLIIALIDICLYVTFFTQLTNFTPPHIHIHIYVHTVLT